MHRSARMLIKTLMTFADAVRNSGKFHGSAHFSAYFSA
jgi:hypothetical protein